MPIKSKLTPNQWIENLAQEELPAITSIASLLDKFSNDDISSIPQLSKTILHDQALSSCLLRVANSSHRSPVHKVTTVSRAAIVLGIQSVKNICLTAKILDGLLHSKNLVPEVYDRLMTLMANAFYAGLLARIMVPNYDENTQEEVYLAAMLYHIGETSFWSTGSDMTKELIKHADLPTDEFQKLCAKATGVSFKTLSVGLAKTWGLGDLLVKSLDQPETRTVEMKIISLANQLTDAIAAPPKDKDKFDRILNDIGQIMQIDQPNLKRRIEDTRKHALELLSSYGAPVLESYIKPLPKSSDFVQQKKVETLALSKEQHLLNAIHELTLLTRSSHNINRFLSMGVAQLASIVGFDECTFWVLNAQKSAVDARICVDDQGQTLSVKNTISIANTRNMISHTLESNKSYLIDDYKHVKWRDYIHQDLQNLVQKGQVCLAPVSVGQKCIGVITAQRLGTSNAISPTDFNQFDILIQHLNMCLMMISRGREHH